MTSGREERSAQAWRPALPPQRQLWLLHGLDSRRADNFVPLALRYEGRLPHHVLCQALGEVVRRHAVLRWQFRTTRDGLEFVEHALTPPVVRVAEAGCTAAGRDWTRLVRRFVSRPFAIGEYPLFRFLHVRLGPREGLVVAVFHHTIADGWSMSVLGAELDALWERMRKGLPSDLPGLQVQYADLYGPGRVAPAASERSLQYWSDALRSLDEAAAWPWPRHKARGASHRVRRVSDRLDAHEAAALAGQAGKLRASPFLFLVAVFSALRARLSGRPSAVVGTDAAGRTDPSAERLIGFFINVLPLRIDTDPRARFVDHLQAVRRQFLTAYEHQHVNYEEIVRSVVPPRGAGRNPLFNVKVMMHNFLDHRLRLPGLTVSGVPVALEGSSEDLKLFIRASGGAYVLDWEAQADAFSDSELAALASLFRDVTRQVLAAPAIALRDLTLRPPEPPAPSRRSDESWPGGLGSLGLSADGSDGRILVRGTESDHTSASFAQQVARVAEGLRALGAGPGVLVALYLTPSVDLLLAACAVLAEGGAFVFIDARDTPEATGKCVRAVRPAFVVAGDAPTDFVAGPELRVLRMQDLLRGAASGRPAPVRTARPGDLALVQVHAGDDGVEAYRFSHASLAAQLAAWAATWRADRGQYVRNADPEDAVSLLADLRVCLEQRRTLLVGDPGRQPAVHATAHADCCYVRVHASRLAQVGPDAIQGGTNVVLEGRVTPAACASVRRACAGARLHVFTRLPGVPLAAGHVEWDDACADLCRMPTGGPFGATTTYLLDAWLQPLPVGGVGEIYVGGEIATAAHEDVRRTARELVPGPFGAGERLWKTGLRGARLADGNIMIVGRRGRVSAAPDRICDPSRVECVLLEHPSVADALVLRAGPPDAPAIVALVTAAREGLREEDLWTVLSGRLTRASLPDAVHVVASLPIDRWGRIVPWQLDLLSNERPPAPETHTPLLAELATVWRELLGLDRDVVADESFFDLGGDSLLATRLAFRIEEQFGVELAIADVFAHRTLAGLAERLAETGTADTAPAVKLEPVDRTGLLPVASAQNRLLFLHRLDPSGAAYNCPVALELRGRPGLPLVMQCFREIARRQEVLRTVFPTVAGEFRQLVRQDVTVSPTFVDLTALPQAHGEAIGRTLRRAELRRPFALEDEPAVRAMVIDRGEGVWELSLTVHHLVSDAWSQRILVHELSVLAARYVAGLPSDLPALPVQYGDYAVWQSTRLQGRHLARLMDGWSRLVASADFEPVRISPMRAPAGGSRRVGYRRFTIPAALQKKLEAACRSRGVTLYMLSLAAFQHLLHRATGKERTTIVASAFNRYPREMENVVGFFANTFPVASRWGAGDTLFLLLERTREYLVDALRLQELPFDRIVEALRRTRPDVDPSRLNVSFVMTPSLGGGLSIPGTEVRSVVVDDVDAKFDLEMQLNAGNDGLAGTLEYATTFLTDEGAGALVAQYVSILEGVVNPAGVKGPMRPITGSRRPVPLAGRIRSTGPERRDDPRPGDSLPAVFTNAPATREGWEAWYAERRPELTAALLTRGAIVFRNTPVSDVHEFRRFCQALAPNLMTYTERSSPRRDLADQVYTSTEYPAAETIFLHNECSYSRTWPRELFFYCERAADSGGETILCDSRRVYERLSEDLRRRWERHGVTYARHYSGFLDLTWETAFQTEDVMEVERYCRAAGITWNWTGSGGLKTRQIGQAALRHPETGESVWFNQAHMFHLSALKDEYRDALLGMFPEGEVPRHAYMGDGSPIAAADLDEIRSVYRSLQCDVRLEQGDILWLDNVLCAHGRRPFSGDRRLAVIMTEPMHAPVPSGSEVAQQCHVPQP